MQLNFETMLHLILFLSTFFGSPRADAGVSVCIGERCNGDKVTLAYLQDHHVLSSQQPGYTVVSFLMSYGKDGSLYEKSFKGNDFGHAVADLKSGKIYFEEIKLTAEGKPDITASAVFTIE